MKKRIFFIIFVIMFLMLFNTKTVFANCETENIEILSIEKIAKKAGKNKSEATDKNKSKATGATSATTPSSKLQPATIDSVIGGMEDVGNVGESSKIKPIINAFIKLFQIAGSGIAVIVVTILGVKYMVASANEKADLKKQAMPIVIGCFVLFAASNIVGIIADVGVGL